MQHKIVDFKQAIKDYLDKKIPSDDSVRIIDLVKDEITSIGDLTLSDVLVMIETNENKDERYLILL